MSPHKTRVLGILRMGYGHGWGRWRGVGVTAISMGGFVTRIREVVMYSSKVLCCVCCVWSHENKFFIIPVTR